MCGLFTLAGATALLQLGSNISVLIAGRVLQGMSAAVVWVVGLALLSDTVSSHEIGEAMGWVGTGMALAILIAPLLGGIVLDKAGYTAVFAMAYGLLAGDIAMRLLMIEKKEAIEWESRLQLRQPSVSAQRWPSPPTLPVYAFEEKITMSMTLRVDTTSSVIGLPKPPPNAYTEETPICSPLSADSSCFQTEPLPPLPANPRVPPIITLLGSRRVLCALWGITVQAALLSAFDSTIPLYVREIFDWNSVGAGLIFLPLLVPAALNPLVGRLVDRHGPRWFATAAFLGAAPLLALLRLVYYNSLDQKVLLCVLLVLLGVCVGLMSGPLMAEITWIVDEKEAKNPEMFGSKGGYAQAFGLLNMAYAVGSLAGPLWGGMIKQHAGWGTMTWTLALLSGVTAIPIAIWCGGSLLRRRGQRDNEQLA